MRFHLGWLAFAMLAISFAASNHVNAASLTGKVTEVNDGDELTVFNLNRPVRIKLIGMDAPEMDQAFGTIAKQHLADLVFDKIVVVEYLGIGHRNSLIGRVLLNNSDINAQMIRDGAAWFDPRYKSQLSDTQNEIYYQSELAARNEKRGLWQSGNAVAPWEFVKAKESQRNVTPSGQVTSLGGAKTPPPAVSELTNLGLFKAATAPPRPRPDQYVESSDKSPSYDGELRKSWKRFRVMGEDFSAMLPNGGEQATKSVPFRLMNSETAVERNFPVSYYLARDGNSLFELLWFQVPEQPGPIDAESVDTSIDAIIQSRIVGSQSQGGNLQCRPLSKKDVSANGYKGAEFDLSECTLPGMARVYTRRVGDQRKYYVGFAFYREEDPNVSKFLSTFTVNPTVKQEVVKSKGTK
jgi:endonuclease YncB( thermonuclease family)